MFFICIEIFLWFSFFSSNIREKNRSCCFLWEVLVIFVIVFNKDWVVLELLVVVSVFWSLFSILSFCFELLIVLLLLFIKYCKICLEKKWWIWW